MSQTPILDALPAREEPLWAEPATHPAGPHWSQTFPVSWLLAVGGWAWRLFAGALLCMNPFTALLVVGWLYRWIQGRVLYAWYRQSPRRQKWTFEEFRRQLGPDAPVTRPRWVLREDFFDTNAMRREVHRPTADGEPPFLFKRLFRWAVAPFRSLWLNFKLGVGGVLATCLLAGWGAALMTFSWEFGWRNSFHKGYEFAAVGPITGLLGIALFALAMLYVPMAQVHQAVTGDFRAFFDFRFVWRLVRARLSAYLVLALAFLGVGLFFEILKTAPAFFDRFPAYEELSDQELLTQLRWYFLACSGFFLVAVLVLRFLGAWLYRSAVLKVLRRGRVKREQLHPRLADWLGRLDMLPEPAPEHSFTSRVVRLHLRRVYRPVLYTLLFVVWVAFTSKVYVGEFLNYHPVVGFLNHPLIQVPCFNYVPPHLAESAD
jgi:hypothetical protein